MFVLYYIIHSLFLLPSSGGYAGESGWYMGPKRAIFYFVLKGVNGLFFYPYSVFSLIYQYILCYFTTLLLLTG